MSLIKRIQAWDSRKRTEANKALVADFSVDAAERYVTWHDHGFFRRYWSNLHQIAPDVFRSNYPNGRRFPKLAELGIKTILNLRGGAGSVPYLLEEHYCRDYGITMHTLNLNAHYAPDPKELLALLDLFDTVEKPLLMHCKSGADRAGLASALYLIHSEGKSVAEAQTMLSFKYLHVNDRKTGIMGHTLRAYGRAQALTGVSLRDWFLREYDQEAEQAAFDAERRN
ncbi:protein tyrosine phosphatase [Cognatishimia sp. D5M38]|uniref:Protein tyrosine phosphatase n=1 Tax=Cognatishimia coralii TaxID=3083254 RepID=A0ABU8QCC0_9RHOB